LLLVAVALAAGVLVVPGQAASPKKGGKKAEGVMQKKLKESQKVLEGIALADFDEVVKHAEELLELSKEARFKVLDTPQYRNYSKDFRSHAEDLIKHAKRKNVDAAALAYVELTLTCVKCHKHVREKRMARAE
jgi:hypothetical protein